MEPALSILRPGSYEEAAEMLAGGSACRIVGGDTKRWGRPAHTAGPAISSERLNRVLEHNAGDFTAVVQAGIPLVRLQEELAEKGQRVALDPPLGAGDAATIGGIVASADSGPLRHRYGTPRDLLLGCAVALPDGSVARSGGKVIKNVAGYDMGKLYAGSFGTLGMIVEVALRLHTLPEGETTVLARASDPGRLVAGIAALTAAPLEPEALDARFSGDTGAVLARFTGPGSEAIAERAAGLLEGAGLAPERAEDAAREWDRQREGQRSEDGAVVRVSSAPADLGRALGAARAHGASLVARAGFGVSWLRLPPAPADELAAAVLSVRAELEPSPCPLLDGPEPVRSQLDALDVDRVEGRSLMEAIKRRIDPRRTCNPGLMGAGL